jgi:hypothetical protein
MSKNLIDNYVSGIDLKGVAWQLTRVGDEFRIEAKERFADSLTNPMKLKGGRTIAQARREELHSLLDEWIDWKLKVMGAMSETPQ